MPLSLLAAAVLAAALSGAAAAEPGDCESGWLPAEMGPMGISEPDWRAECARGVSREQALAALLDRKRGKKAPSLQGAALQALFDGGSPRARKPGERTLADPGPRERLYLEISGLAADGCEEHGRGKAGLGRWLGARAAASPAFRARLESFYAMVRERERYGPGRRPNESDGAGRGPARDLPPGWLWTLALESAGSVPREAMRLIAHCGYDDAGARDPICPPSTSVLFLPRSLDAADPGPSPSPEPARMHRYYAGALYGCELAAAGASGEEAAGIALDGAWARGRLCRDRDAAFYGSARRRLLARFPRERRKDESEELFLQRTLRRELARKDGPGEWLPLAELDAYELMKGGAIPGSWSPARAAAAKRRREELDADAERSNRQHAAGARFGARVCGKN